MPTHDRRRLHVHEELAPSPPDEPLDGSKLRSTPSSREAAELLSEGEILGDEFGSTAKHACPFEPAGRFWSVTTMPSTARRLVLALTGSDSSPSGRH